MFVSFVPSPVNYLGDGRIIVEAFKLLVRNYLALVFVLVMPIERVVVCRWRAIGVRRYWRRTGCLCGIAKDWAIEPNDLGE